MAQTKIDQSISIVERNLGLTRKIMGYLMNNPEVFSALPDNFELVILPEDDPEIRLHNLDLLDKYSYENVPVVFARLKSATIPLSYNLDPSLFVPINTNSISL